MSTLRQTGGVSGYPSRAESPHDWIENSHASTALSYADGLSKAIRDPGERRTVVAIVGDGALTGGMCWEALNNISVAQLPVVIVVNDNGRSYAPTIGAFAQHLARAPAAPGIRARARQREAQPPSGAGRGAAFLRGAARYEARHEGHAAPQGMFEDLGLKYVGPVDGHDVAAVEHALRLARGFNGPVIVHAVTRKGYGYPPAENDQTDQMHQSRGFDPATGSADGDRGPDLTGVFSDELLRIADTRDDVVAITAAMCEPTGLGPFARRYPDRFYDVGIAEQHAVTSAAGMATGGLHPVVAIYATFLNRAFDQVLLDVALHRLPVTFVLDRAGLTGDDGPSHNGMWDLAILGVVPGLRIAAPRDETTLRMALDEAIEDDAGPTVVRFPKTPLGHDLPPIRQIGGVDVLAEPDVDASVDVLVVSIGPLAYEVLDAAARVREAGFTVRVVDPRWVKPIPVSWRIWRGPPVWSCTVEDGVVASGVGARVAQALRVSGIDIPNS